MKDTIVYYFQFLLLKNVFKFCNIKNIQNIDFYLFLKITTFALNTFTESLKIDEKLHSQRLISSMRYKQSSTLIFSLVNVAPKRHYLALENKKNTHMEKGEGCIIDGQRNKIYLILKRLLNLIRMQKDTIMPLFMSLPKYFSNF